MRRLDLAVAQRIGQAVTHLAETEHGDICQLRGVEREWRLRVGQWRVLFELDRAEHLMIIQLVLPRGRAYRR